MGQAVITTHLENAEFRSWGHPCSKREPCARCQGGSWAHAPCTAQLEGGFCWRAGCLLLQPGATNARADLTAPTSVSAGTELRLILVFDTLSTSDASLVSLPWTLLYPSHQLTQNVVWKYFQQMKKKLLNLWWVIYRDSELMPENQTREDMRKPRVKKGWKQRWK